MPRESEWTLLVFSEWVCRKEICFGLVCGCSGGKWGEISHVRSFFFDAPSLGRLGMIQITLLREKLCGVWGLYHVNPFWNNRVKYNHVGTSPKLWSSPNEEIPSSSTMRVTTCMHNKKIKTPTIHGCHGAMWWLYNSCRMIFWSRRRNNYPCPNHATASFWSPPSCLELHVWRPTSTPPYVYMT